MDKTFSGNIKEGEVLSSTIVFNNNLQSELVAETTPPKPLPTPAPNPEFSFSLEHVGGAIAAIAGLAVAIFLLKRK